MKKLILLSIILLLTVPVIYAQNLNNVYSAYGFAAPFLKSGEFILTASGNYNWGDGEYDYTDNPDSYYLDYYSRSESANTYMWTRLVIAVTDKFLISSNLYIYPGMVTSRSYWGSTTYERESWSTRKFYLYPNLSLIFRPAKNLEISSYFYHYGYTYSSDRIYDDVESHNNDRDYKYTSARVSVNYFGKLWGK